MDNKLEGIKRKGLNKKIGETSYKPEYCELLEKHLSYGFSFDSFTDAGVCLSTLYNWVDNYPDFKTAKKIGTQKALKFHENLLRQKLTGMDTEKVKSKKIDTACLIFALKTRFHATYGERQKVEQTHKVEEETKRLFIDMGADE